MSSLVNPIGAIVGGLVGVAAIVIASLTWLEQRKQTRVMAAQVDKQVEIKLTRDLGDDDAAPKSVVDSTLRNYLNSRLAKVRADLRDEFNKRLIDLALGDSSKEAVKMFNRQAEAVEKLEDSANNVATHEQEIQALKHIVEELRHGVGAPDMVQMQIRKIAELLLSATEHDRESDGWPITDTVSTTDAAPFTNTLPTFDTP